MGIFSMTPAPASDSQIIYVKRMSMMDLCPWALWTMLALMTVLLLMLLWRLIKVRTTVPGAFYFGGSALLFLLPCVGVALELGQFVARVPLMSDGLADPKEVLDWDVYISTSCFFVAFAAAAASLFVVLGLGVTALHRLVGKRRSAEAA